MCGDGSTVSFRWVSRAATLCTTVSLCLSAFCANFMGEGMERGGKRVSCSSFYWLVLSWSFTISYSLLDFAPLLLTEVPSLLRLL